MRIASSCSTVSVAKFLPTPLLTNSSADTPYGVDPFTFVSTAVEDHKAAKQAAAAPQDGFVVPALPDRIVNGGGQANAVQSSGVPASDSANGEQKATKPRTSGAAALKPKSPFPDEHLTALFAKIDALATGSLILLVEAAYQDLKEHKVKKNAVEAKIREVAEKTGQPKVWAVRPEARVSPSAPARTHALLTTFLGIACGVRF
jgi:chromatin assembly factor 1 subunit A